MNDIDDYEFSPVENSNLSSICGIDNSSEDTNNSLFYKAPKRAIAVKEAKAQTPNFSYKYINLYEIVRNTQQKFGKHIVCLLRPETNTPEILIYQNKKNILVRSFISTINTSIHPEIKCCLSILTNKRKFLLEFNSEEDFNDFNSEFTSIGGIIQKNSTDKNQMKPQNEGDSVKNELPLLHPKTILSGLKSPESIASIGSIDPVEGISVEEDATVASSDDTQDKNEKDVILARLARMGLPQLPSFQKDITDCSQVKLKETLGNENIASTSTFKSKEQCDEEYKTGNNIHLETFNNDGALVTCMVDKSNCNTQDVQILNRPIDPISFMMAENRLNNTEIRHQISLLTSTMSKMNSKQRETQSDDQLKSKLRAYKMKSENLESELHQIKKRYVELQRLNEELSEKVKNSKGKITNCTNPENDVDILKSNVKELLSFIENLSPETTDIDLSPLKNLRENFKDQELQLILENSISIIQNKIDSQKINDDTSLSKKRAEFLKGTKHIMNNLYSKISNLLDDEMKNSLAEDVRFTTLELIRNYDAKIHDTVG